MRIAVISDVHGNLPALEAVLADMGSIDALLCCGDLVGYYPDVAEVVDRLRALGALSVRGNHELMATGAIPAPVERAGYYRIDWTRRALSPEQLGWLAALPCALELHRDGLAIEVRHASPWDEETYLYPDSPALAGLTLPDARWLFLGHTHHPMLVRAGGGVVVNPGSVGQPRDWNPKAAYGVLDTASGGWEQRRVGYDHRAYQRRLEVMGVDPRSVGLLGRMRFA
ncbi:MAG: metallophosphoesterase family protein [Deltaproteobacteria bacterium]|nr:metallophosphoesterase family protein [Deltaproteobacteria bacterium]